MSTINCQQFPSYYIEENETSTGAECYKKYTTTSDKNEKEKLDILINNKICSQFQNITSESADYNNCILNWKSNKYKDQWLNAICLNSALYLVPDKILSEVYDYTNLTKIPGMFCELCEKNISIIFKKLSEEQKLGIDVWVARNINASFITPEIMQRIQDYKKIRINEQFESIQDTPAAQQLKAQQQLQEALDSFSSNFKKALPYLLILIVCLISIGFLVALFKNTSKLSKLGKDTQDDI